MNSNTGFKKVFHKAKVAEREYGKSKQKEPSWKKDQRKQQKRNWMEG